MKRFLPILICMLTLLPALGQGLFVSWNRFAPSGPFGTCGWDGNYLVQQNFEEPTTGYDHGETWTPAGNGIINPAYSGLVLQGTQSMRFSQSGQAGQTQTTIAAQDEVWVYFMMRIVSIGAHNPTWFGWLNEGTATLAFHINNDFTISLSGGSSATTAATVTTGVTYHFWMHYKKGTGANQIQEVAFSTDGIKPLSGSNYAAVLNGNRTAPITTLTLMWNFSTWTHEYIFDKVRIATTCIGDNPP